MVSGARLVLVDGNEEAWERVREVRRPLEGVTFVRLGEVKGEVEGMGTERVPDELRSGVKGTDPMALFFTSGTTGRPKGCALPVVAAFGHGYGSVAGTNPVQGGDQRYCELDLAW
jgi:acyl-coenzyme A synthetase/AMP-(fatty) acid ligase